ncbi:MAG: hypothetical protein LUF33_00025 [Clostridiales bacterium]|nr:hypothetical protein [Clostridiales bacterium]
MKFPSLVRPSVYKTPVTVVIYGEGLTEDGAPNELVNGSFYCNLQSKSKTVLTAQKKSVQCSAAILISGDIAPDLPVISGGFAEIFGVKREIAQGIKARNPDGTVNYTELDVI